MEKKVLLGVLVTSLFLVQYCSCGKILSAVFISTKSNKIVYDPLLEALAARGHEVTVVSPFPLNKNITNLKDIQTLDMGAMMEKYPNMFELKETNQKFNPLLLTAVYEDICRRTVVLPEVQTLLYQKFDLIFNSPFLNDCTLGYLSQFKAPVVLIVPVVAPPYIAGALGSPSPLSFVPNYSSGFQEKMNFRERFMNFFIELLQNLTMRLKYFPKMEAVYRDALGKPELPGVLEIYQNVSLVLSNSHLSLSSRRPFLPDIIEVGGMHCHPANPLPKDLEDFVQSSGKDGFIFFSMGSLLNGSKMPDKYRKILLSAFAQLKQKVIWKWETETMEDLPSNVKLIKWAPQQDLLGHPKIRAFITHGGMGSTTEAVYHGVPLIGIPMVVDQLLNIQQSVASGYAIALEYLELSEEKVLTAINTVLEDPTYKEKAQSLSAIFRDQPMKPLDRAVYWTEYVLRHKGAAHLRSAARDLNFFQYHSLDVLGTLFAVIVFAVYTSFAVIRCIARKMLRFSKSNTPSVENQKKNK